MLKESIYNNVVVENQRTYIYNSLTKARILLESGEEFSTIISDVKEESVLGATRSKELQMLIDNGFLVEDSIDEQEVLKYIFYKRFFESDKLGLILMPTLKCNFNCPYCFEKSSKNLISEDNNDYFEVVYRFLAKNIQRYRHCHLSFLVENLYYKKNRYPILH